MAEQAAWPMKPCFTPLGLLIDYTVTNLVAGEPVENIQAANARLGRGINLANALEAPKESEWGVTLHPEYFQLFARPVSHPFDCPFVGPRMP